MTDASDRVPLYAFAAHAIGDWPLQSDRMAAEKLDNPRVRAEHVAVYTASFLPVALAADWDRRGMVVFLGSVAGSHYVIDSRRWKEPVEGFESRPIWFDQVFHVVAIAAAVFLADQCVQQEPGCGEEVER